MGVVQQRLRCGLLVGGSLAQGGQVCSLQLVVKNGAQAGRQQSSQVLAAACCWSRLAHGSFMPASQPPCNLPATSPHACRVSPIPLQPSSIHACPQDFTILVLLGAGCLSLGLELLVNRKAGGESSWIEGASILAAGAGAC